MKYILALLFLIPFSLLAIPADVSMCFTPGQRCDMRIIDAIDRAQRTIYVQAYQLTSWPIRDALIDAKQRGVKIEIILDKSQDRGKYPAAIFFHNMQIPVWIDYRPAIAHNKVMIIDDSIVVTGSYNFSKAAQYRNAENLIIINRKDIADIYLQNFKKRLKVSAALADY